MSTSNPVLKRVSQDLSPVLGGEFRHLCTLAQRSSKTEPELPFQIFDSVIEFVNAMGGDGLAYLNQVYAQVTRKV
jgi:hypothetical protein